VQNPRSARVDTAQEQQRLPTGITGFGEFRPCGVLL
jgi:hypothetical protein